jgi:uncharacterized protein (DUF2235 family)
MSPGFQPLNILALTSTDDVRQQNEDVHIDVPNDETKGRILILCFDGTGNKFGEENSNVVRFFRALVKNKRKQQLVYYQPGIGTYNKRTFMTHTMDTLSSKLDEAIATGIDDHVKQGYQFIVQNYRPNDKICLFGFSRGAHTARVVAGMVYKVGILPKENIQQVDFAFNVYGSTGHHGYRLGREFKWTFTPTASPPVSVDFVGVWDTVSSVGIVPQMHPYTSVNYAVKTFRHALALDERRVRFRPNVWSEITLEREQELDIDIPVSDSIPAGVHRDEWQYTPPMRDHADVKEVWFTGCHADVGGGSHPTDRLSSLSFVPLRWMIKECILCKTGIQFDLDYLQEVLDFDFERLLEDMKEKDIKIKDLGEGYADLQKYVSENDLHHPANKSIIFHEHQTLRQRFRSHASDILDDIFDQLILVWFWWVLEIIPMLYTYQNQQGDWIRRRMRNFGRGRYIPVHEGKVLVHKTVEKRMKDKKDKKYKPKAHNWDHLNKSGVVEYVD